MYFLFAWYEGQQVGGAYDLVGTFRTAKAAIAKAEFFIESDCRFDVQVTDSKLKILYETNNRNLEFEMDLNEDFLTQ